MKLTREYLEKFFGKDDTSNKTCDCNECITVEHILKNQEIVERLKKRIKEIDDECTEIFIKTPLEDLRCEENILDELQSILGEKK